jgi:hypothetical protein
LLKNKKARKKTNTISNLDDLDQKYLKPNMGKLHNIYTDGCTSP